MKTIYGTKRAVAINSYQIALSRLLRKENVAEVAEKLLKKYNKIFSNYQDMHYNIDADFYAEKLNKLEAQLDGMIPIIHKV